MYGYLDMLLKLLPRGAAWPREAGTTLYKLLDAMAAEFERVHGRAFELIEEADPATTNELLPEWEHELGIDVDPTLPPAESTETRRLRVLTRDTEIGGQSNGYIIDQAAKLGYAITITEYREAKAGVARAGDRITNTTWPYVWTVNVPDATVQYARAGKATAGDRLRVTDAELLEIVIGRIAPAHTEVIFSYGG